MILLTEYLLSKKQHKLSDKKSSKLEAWERCNGIHHIPSDIIRQYIIDALEINWLTPDDILSEWYKFKNDEDFENAYPDNTPTYKKFEDTLCEILLDSAYSGKEGDILDYVFTKVNEIMEEIKETFENDTNK